MLRFLCAGFFACAMLSFVSQPISLAQDDDELTRQEITELFQDAQSYMQDEDWGEAAKIYKKIIDSNDKIGPVWFQYAYCLHMDGKLDEAIKAHKRAAKFEQFAPVATYNLACAYALQKKTDEAIEALQKAVKLGFNDADQIEGDSDMDNIREDKRFKKIMAKLNDEDEDSDDDDGHKEDKDKKGEKHEHGDDDHEHGDKDDDSDEQRANELVNEAREMMQEGEFAAAAKVFAKACKADPKNGTACHLYGYCLHASGDLDEAIKIHKKAAKFKQFAGISTYNLGCAYSLKKYADKAFKALNEAVKLGFVRDTAYDDDADLDNIRDDKRFEELMKKVNEKRDNEDDK